MSGKSMTKTDWLMRFRRCRSIDTLETVYEHLKYEGDPKEEFAFTSAYDHRKAELTVGKLFDRVPAHVWKLVS
ncbi:hemolysin expression modulating family protein (plasmid) [Pantoea sp. At-9b]|nr:hemolysin expression modulating family protein [Pantoea sp. At-9b]